MNENFGPTDSLVASPTKHVLVHIPVNKIVVDKQRFAYRDDEGFSGPKFDAFAEDIAQQSVIVPILVQKLKDGRFQLRDGHRRMHAVHQHIKNGLKGFDDSYEIPAVVLDPDVDERIVLSQAIAANIQKEKLPQEGRIRAVVDLFRAGMPRKFIASLMSVKEATICRDLRLGLNEEMMQLVSQEHYITATHAASLLSDAEAAGRVDELIAAVKKFGADVERDNSIENRRRRANDEAPLTGSQLWPQKSFTAEHLKQWRLDLKQGLPLQSPLFRYRAGIRTDKNGIRTLQIDGLHKNLADFPPDARRKVLLRLAQVTAELAPLVVDGDSPSTDGARATPMPTARELLNAIGITTLMDDVVSDGDDFFDDEDDAIEQEQEQEDADSPGVDNDDEPDESDEGSSSAASVADSDSKGGTASRPSTKQSSDGKAARRRR